MPDAQLYSDAAFSPARLTVDLRAIADNWRQLARLGADAACAAVVKADAYGLGMARVAPVLAAAGCRSFFVAFAEEGVALRAVLGGGPRIYVLCAGAGDAPESYIAHQLTPVISSPAHLAAWSVQGILSGLAFLCQVETGMHRLGLAPESAAAALRLPECLGLMSHLACADDATSALNLRQLERFRAVLRDLPARHPAPILSLVNSAGIFLGSDWHFNLLRPGIALYGGNPTQGRPNPMRRVVTLEAAILQKQDVPAGESVGYGATYICRRDSTIVIVGVGYADGMHRLLSNRGQAAIGGHVVPYVGRVSMDMLALDVSAVPPAVLAQDPPVELLGPTIDIDALATAAGTISYEILTGLGPRLRRVYRA